MYRYYNPDVSFAVSEICLKSRTQTHTHTHSYICQNTHAHTSICSKIRIAAPYYIKYTFEKWHQQLTINQLIFSLLIVPLIGLRLMIAPRQLIRSCGLLQHTVVVAFIIGPSCLVSGNELSGPSCHLGRAV